MLFMIMARTFYRLPSISFFYQIHIQRSGLDPFTQGEPLAGAVVDTPFVSGRPG